MSLSIEHTANGDEQPSRCRAIRSSAAADAVAAIRSIDLYSFGPFVFISDLNKYR